MRTFLYIAIDVALCALLTWGGVSLMDKGHDALRSSREDREAIADTANKILCAEVLREAARGQDPSSEYHKITEWYLERLVNEGNDYERLLQLLTPEDRRSVQASSAVRGYLLKRDTTKAEVVRAYEHNWNLTNGFGALLLVAAALLGVWVSLTIAKVLLYGVVATVRSAWKGDNQ